MSPLAELTNPGRSDVLSGFILSAPTIREIGASEQRIAAAYLETLTLARPLLPAPVFKELLDGARNDIKWADFGYGGAVFLRWFNLPTMLPFFAWLSALVKHPAVTFEDVAKLVGAMPDTTTLREAVAELWGFTPRKNDAGGAAATASTAIQTGNPSTASPAGPPSPEGTGSPPTNSST